MPSGQNTGPVTLNFGSYILPQIPVYLAVLVPLIAGLSFGFFVNLIKNLSQNLTISEKKDKIKDLKDELAEVTKKAHQLELENSKLKGELGNPEDENSI